MQTMLPIITGLAGILIFFAILAQVVYAIDRGLLYFQRQRQLRDNRAHQTRIEDQNKKEWAKLHEAVRWSKIIKPKIESDSSQNHGVISKKLLDIRNQHKEQTVFDLPEGWDPSELFPIENVIAMSKVEMFAWIDNAIDPPTEKDYQALEARLIMEEAYEHLAWLQERK